MTMFLPVAPTIRVPPRRIAADTWVIHSVQQALGQPLFVHLNSRGARVGTSPAEAELLHAERERRTLVAVSAVDPAGEKELVVAADGSIPADQLARLGVGPGTHLRVVDAGTAAPETTELAGSLPDFPDVEWEAFQAASDLSGRDLAGSS